MAFQFPKHLSNFQGVIRIPKRLQRNKAFESDVDRKDQMELKIMLNHDKTFTRIILYMNFFNSSGHSLPNTIFWCWIILYYISIIWVYLSFFLVFYNERVCLFVCLFLGWFLSRRDERDFNTKGKSPLMKPPLMKYVKSKRFSTKTKSCTSNWKKRKSQLILFTKRRKREKVHK